MARCWPPSLFVDRDEPDPAAQGRLMPDRRAEVLRRELAYHEKLYGGFAQRHFARPAVRALREHMVRRILRLTGAAAARGC